jgi:hypothetical protein
MKRKYFTPHSCKMISFAVYQLKLNGPPYAYVNQELRSVSL